MIDIKFLLQFLGTFTGSTVIYSSNAKWETLIGIVIVALGNYYAGSIDTKIKRRGLNEKK